jgi:very-short-patch-repair endonuclease
MRHGQSSISEDVMARLLRDTGVRWRRQYPVGGYWIADFACPELRLLVEVDGPHHRHPAQRGKDHRRDEILAGQGWQTIRIPTEHLWSHHGDRSRVRADLAASIRAMVAIRATLLANHVTHR